MRRGRDPIPRTRSEFFVVKCPDCGEERTVFSNAAKDVGCRGCGRVLAEARGGKALVTGQIVKKLD